MLRDQRLFHSCNAFSGLSMGTNLPPGSGQQFSSQPLLGGPEPTEHTNWSAQANWPGLAGQTSRQPLGSTSAQSVSRQQPQSANEQSGSRQHSEATERRDQQKWKDFDDEKDGGGAATAGKAQVALDAVEKGHTNKTNPDKDDDHSGYGATATGSSSALRDQEGTAHLTGNDAGTKGSWLTHLIGEAQMLFNF